MATLLVRHRITDFDAWLALHDQMAATRRAHGCTGARPYRQADDPDAVAIALDFPTPAQAHAFLADPALPEAMSRPGIAGPAELVLLDPVVPPSAAKKAVLLVGLEPRVIDFSDYPGLDEAKLVAGLAASLAATTAAGFDAEWCLVTTDWQEVEAAVRARLAARDWAAVMIGAGIRTAPSQLLLFERLVNLIHAVAPDARLCFSTSPDSAAEAVLRWVQP
ncbi:hypothetical protein SAMN02745121_08410 [Nannocystis exedens]|uniref:Uncharacterized protein n=1 Tax=Nannocystis exedens TaxID=54 RepID=A0A1I2I2Q6_9BACT|nr:hypothetical protein [Nannocystis exedens]PCC74923.1 hypothetical protein NAEX_08023 [Nannocystis exedens]SFF36699.1 hypothetical protein SAMN02745121_08410 [Nannocystis exedens]